MRERIRACLLPTLMISIIGSLWVVGTSRELEEDLHVGRYAGPGVSMRRHLVSDDGSRPSSVAATPIEP